MKFNLDYVLSELGQDGSIVAHYNKERANQYSGAVWLETFDGTFQDHIIYIGEGSLLPDVLPDAPIGLIVTNETNRDFRACPFEVIEVKKGTDLAALCLHVKETFFRSTDVSDTSSELLTGLLYNSSVKEIADLIYKHIGNPTLIYFTAPLDIYFFSCRKGLEASFAVLDCIPETLRPTEVDTLDPRPQTQSDGYCFPGCKRQIMPITEGIHSRKVIGTITVFEKDSPLHPRDGIFLALCAHVLSMKAPERGFQQQIAGFHYEQELQDLISGKTTRVSESLSSTLFRYLETGYQFYLFDIRKMNKYETENFRVALSAKYISAVTFLRGAYLAAIIPKPKAEDERASRTAHLAQLSDRHAVSVGISDAFHSLEHLQKYYLQAKLSLDHAKNTGCSIVDFCSFRPEILLSDWKKKEENAYVYEDHAMEAIEEYDVKYGTEYALTLKTFFSTGMDREKTRALLNIHRNTLPYRLDKAAQIAGIDLSDGKALFNLWLSCMMHESQRH